MTHLSLLQHGGMARRGDRLSGRERFKTFPGKGKKKKNCGEKNSRNGKDSIFIVSVSAFMWDSVSSCSPRTLTSKQMLRSQELCVFGSHSRRCAHAKVSV